MNKTAETAAPILPVLAERWSPRSFDADYVISDQDVTSLLEAARWAPSANNIQPWRYSVLKRDTELFEQLTSQSLSGFNQAWAPRASALIVVSIQTLTGDGKTNHYAPYDAGLSVANLVIQTHALGLHAHQIGGFNHETAIEILQLDADIKPVVVVAVGKVAPAENLEGGAYEREIAHRSRLNLDEIVLHGKP